MLAVVFLARVFFSLFDAFLEVALLGACFSLSFLSAVRLALVILLSFFLAAVCVAKLARHRILWRPLVGHPATTG